MIRSSLIVVGVLSLMPGWLQAAPVEVISPSELEKRVSRLERMLENPVLLQLSQRLAEQQKEIQSMQDRIDRLTFRLRQTQQQTQQQIIALQERVAALEARLKNSPPVHETVPTPDETTVHPASSAQGVSSSRGGATSGDMAAQRQAYDAAMALLRKGKYQQAVQAFDAFIQRYPHASLAPNAAYWAGEAYMVLLDFRSALARFERVVKAYPKSGKYYDSLYRSTEALYKLGQRKEARARLQQLIKDQNAPDKLKKRAQALLEKWRGKTS
ncbi:MAG TPA: tol-pal system protein YbgF [Sulfurivirga caldicuralii]|nr:tol-pal system protein YbgF [Sulfurivirga caldicuralii]